MKELITLSLAQIVNKNHRAASVFEKYHLDFCCKGKRTLKEACEERNLEINTIISDLENISGIREEDEVDFNGASLAQLIDYIIGTHHSYVKKGMPDIFVYLQKIASVRKPEEIQRYNIETLINLLLAQAPVITLHIYHPNFCSGLLLKIDPCKSKPALYGIGIDH